jgi:hypothetical protein
VSGDWERILPQGLIRLGLDCTRLEKIISPKLLKDCGCGVAISSQVLNPIPNRLNPDTCVPSPSCDDRRRGRVRKCNKSGRNEVDRERHRPSSTYS